SFHHTSVMTTQTNIKPGPIAFQGEPGSFSEAAAVKFFGDGISTLPRRTFDSVFEAVESGDAGCGIIPIENSLAGSIHRNYDLLLRHDLTITGEVYLRIRHCLIGLPGAVLESIERVYSHPQALDQCETFLKSLNDVETVPFYDTAGSVKHIKESGDSGDAAIGSRRAAVDFKMDVLAENIENFAGNYTRFLVVALAGAESVVTNKSSIVFAAKNIPGALFKCLEVFAQQGINLLKIESRPSPGRPGEYYFYLDFLGSPAETECQKALGHLTELTNFIRVLGSYEMAPVPAPETDGAQTVENEQ
ncbi:prephenate dehydratase, partial [candidate division KSB1 bacterium]